MRIDIPNNSATFVGIRIALTGGDLQRLVERLQLLMSSPDQHFHLTADGDAAFVDLEVGVQGGDETSNAMMTGLAIEPDGP